MKVVTPSNTNGASRAGTILLVDRDRDVLASFQKMFAGNGCRVAWAEGFPEAFDHVGADRPDVLVMDAHAPPSEDFDHLARLRELEPNLPIIVMTASGATGTAIEAMKRGASDFALKPVREQKMRELVSRAMSEARASVADRLHAATLSEEDLRQELVGRSEAMQRVFKRIGQVAASDAAALISGEYGTGKERVARAIYRNSPRAKRAFLSVDCAATRELQLESELFGYERGAFTGATSRKRGKFELCDGGTLLIDQVCDMSPSTQTKFLRFLNDGTFERLGGSESLVANVRVIATTQRDLEREVAEGRFRADLYYRLKVVQIDLPPLRERQDDIPLLVEFCLRKLDDAAARKSPTRVSESAMRKLMAHPWPGNARQLENFIHTIYFTRSGAVILPGDIELPEESAPATAFARPSAPQTMSAAPPPAEERLPAPAPEVRESAPFSAPAEPSRLAPTPQPAREASFGASEWLGDPASADERTFEAYLDQQIEGIFRAVVARRERDPRNCPLEAVERSLVRRALNETNGNQVRAAKILGMSRATLRKRIERFDIVIERRAR